ncbi:TPA: DUF551 domain-containing protein [Salmonella enterica]|nr:DUF551 domain-containing protein [Salmonella enterica subsp. enterica serovar Corvallis]EBF9469450.1 DUF551 domain-containing protein [Salmonella enterica subsp. enterica serovar Corvallis]EBV3101970.1 DUF551 domain-containing protein [Salmonella enterica subsp. enterica serovar Corvallis]EBZ5454615.1 DUF551 domain-containing protein [Salmonella enterica subsp. enterica serovar Corvallis]HCT1044308.1 DUF551 domain-containing protein [Salmonella enterica subsp. enterica serovar Corvallis]
MSTITKERIELFIKSPLENGLTRGEQMELARIALASLEAEPVAWKATFTQIDHEYNTFTAMYSDKAEAERWVRLHKVGDFRADITPLYTAKPVPVVPGEIADDLMEKLPKSDAWANGFRGGWNSCRAVMLQSGNFREIAETSTNSPVIPSEVLSAILKFARVRADFDDFDGDRRGIGDCLDEAEQELIVTINKHASQLAAGPIAPNDVREQTAIPPVPGTPDSWISCSDRMPEKGQNVLISVNFDSSLVEPLICSARYTGSTFRRGDATIKPGNGIEQATHWMPLPEPPQEVNRG